MTTSQTWRAMAHAARLTIPAPHPIHAALEAHDDAALTRLGRELHQTDPELAQRWVREFCRMVTLATLELACAPVGGRA